MPPIQRPSRILVVDDNADNRFVLENLLAHRGHQVSSAVNGAEALAAVERERPDLVLMDLDMPVMNGWEAIEHIRANPEVASLPIIVLSAHALLGDEEKAMPGQCDGFLPKPFNTQQVMALIGEILERGREPASDVSE